MNLQAPVGSQMPASATNPPPKRHIDASMGSTSVICTTGPYPMSDVVSAPVGHGPLPNVASLPADCPANGVTGGALITSDICQTHPPLDAYFADATHSENPAQNVADATAALSRLSLVSPKKVTTWSRRAIGSSRSDAKAAKPEGRKPCAPAVNSESSSSPIRQSPRLSSAQQDEYDDIQLPFKKRRCSLYYPEDPSTSSWPSSKRALLETITEEEEVVLPSQRRSGSNQHHL